MAEQTANQTTGDALLDPRAVHRSNLALNMTLPWGHRLTLHLQSSMLADTATGEFEQTVDAWLDPWDMHGINLASTTR